MPSPVAHGLLGASVVAALHPRLRPGKYQKVIFGALLANVADIDFLLVLALSDKTWHRGFTHSLSFAFLTLPVFVLWLGRRRLRNAIAYSLAYASHAILDFVTTKKGGGLELLWPFSDHRFKLGYFGLSEAPSKMSGVEVLVALGLEFVIFTSLFLAVMLLVTYRQNKTGVVQS